MMIVLGSKSARRKELLAQMGYDFYVDSVDIDESIENYIDANDYVLKVVTKKGQAVLQKHPNEIIICADTIVVVDEVILGKPKNKDDARNMINLIQNRSHEVLTAVFIANNSSYEVFVEKTVVVIDEIDSDEVEQYILTDEPYDKAGGYAIQGVFAKYIKSINGDFYNVMGLPINKLYKKLKKLN